MTRLPAIRVWSHPTPFLKKIPPATRSRTHASRRRTDVGPKYHAQISVLKANAKPTRQRGRRAGPRGSRRVGGLIKDVTAVTIANATSSEGEPETTQGRTLLASVLRAESRFRVCRWC